MKSPHLYGVHVQALVMGPLGVDGEFMLVSLDCSESCSFILYSVPKERRLRYGSVNIGGVSSVKPLYPREI